MTRGGKVRDCSIIVDQFGRIIVVKMDNTQDLQSSVISSSNGSEDIWYKKKINHFSNEE